MSQVFISYKTGTETGLSVKAESLERDLKSKGLDVWRDTSQLVAGDDWNTEIYEAIQKSGVLLLLLSPKAVKSDWIRREVDVAKGAKVKIIPLVIETKDADGELKISEALDTFDLPRRQYIDWTSDTNRKLDDLVQAIRKGFKETEHQRKKWLASLPEVVRCRPNNAKADEYEFVDLRKNPLRIFIARGDLTAMSGIDVVVNSENNYMQMGRFFEKVSISSQLRLKGARMDTNGNIEYDTVQMELNEQCLRGGYRIPINVGNVVPTHAGDPNNKLAEKGFRYIFHLSTVIVNPFDQKNRTVPIGTDTIGLAVENTIREVIRVNRRKGVISPVGTSRYEEEEKQKDSYKPIKSIILPMFGTGHAGNPDVSGVAHAIVDSLVEHVLDYADAADFSLESIHIAAFTEDDYTIVKGELDSEERLSCVRQFSRAKPR